MRKIGIVVGHCELLDMVGYGFGTAWGVRGWRGEYWSE